MFYISTQIPPAASGADQDLQRNADRRNGMLPFGAFYRHLYLPFLIHGVKDPKKDFILQCMYKKAMLYTEGAVLIIQLLCQMIANDSKDL